MSVDTGSGTNVEHLGIGTLLKRPLAVPANQRAYSWKDDQIDDLVNDIKSAIDQGGSAERDYFLGSIVLTSSSDFARPWVVDGQQRLASVMMIYAAIRDYLANHGESGIAEDVADDFLRNKDKWTKVESSRLQLSDEDSGFFERYVLPAPDSSDRKALKVGKRAPDSHRRIEKAFSKISQAIAAFADAAPKPLDALRQWETYLEHNVKVLVLTVPDESRAYQIFETLNDRGLDLAIADLLKNYIFGKVGKTKLNQAKHHWATALATVSADGRETLIKRFIHHFWSSHHGLTRERLLYKRIRDDIRNENKALSFVQQLASSAYNYAAILSPDNELWSGTGTTGRRFVGALKMLQMEQYKPLLLACLDTFNPNKPTELVKVLRLLVSWSVRFQITQKLGSSEIEIFYPTAAKTVRDEKVTTAAQLIKLFKTKIPGDALFESEFSTYSEDNERLARYYLHAIEDVLWSDAGGGEEEISKNEGQVNLEHVLPLQAKLSEWRAFDEETAKVNKTRLGNQTLLREKWNRELSNRPFNQKREVYQRSVVKITKPILDYKSWSPDAVSERQNWLAKVAVRAWPLDI